MQGLNHTHIALDSSSLVNVKPDSNLSVENIDYQKAKMFTVHYKPT